MLFCDNAIGQQCNTTIEGFTWNFDVNNDEEVPGIPSADICRDLCQKKYDCQGFTWTYGDIINNCYMFTDLKQLHECDECISGTVPDMLYGGCVGGANDFVDVAVTETAKACYEFCLATEDCDAYTWWNTTSLFVNTCFLYSSCDEQQSCHGGCTSGKMNCISNGPDVCNNYWFLDDAGRSIENEVNCYDNNLCTCDYTGSNGQSPDWHGPGNYRFFPFSTMMPESSPGTWHCGTEAPGWLKGQHPTVEGEEVRMDVCFDYGPVLGNCYYKSHINVTLCPGRITTKLYIYVNANFQPFNITDFFFFKKHFSKKKYKRF